MRFHRVTGTPSRIPGFIRHRFAWRTAASSSRSYHVASDHVRVRFDLEFLVRMNWARRLKRVFGIAIEGCARCGGKLRIIARIEEPQVIARILSHLERTAPPVQSSVL